MYPPTDVLEEVGRVTIAGARLDLEMGMLWATFDHSADAEKARMAPGAEQARSVRKLADRWLAGELLTAVLDMADQADNVRNRRNDIVHQDWMLRGRDAMRLVSDLPPDFVPGSDAGRASGAGSVRALPAGLKHRVPSFDASTGSGVPGHGSLTT
jgi:hypothetical protein